MAKTGPMQGATHDLEIEIPKFLNGHQVQTTKLTGAELKIAFTLWNQTFTELPPVDCKASKVDWNRVPKNGNVLIGEENKPEKAIAEYLKQFPAEYLVLFGKRTPFGYRCVGPYVDFFDHLIDDLYICHANMKWTMIYTHEQPWIGPYFIYKDEKTAIKTIRDLK